MPAVGLDLPAAATASDIHQVDKPLSHATEALPLFRAPVRRVNGQAKDLPPGELDDTAPAITLPGRVLRERHLSLGEALDKQAGVRVQSLSGFGAPTLLTVRGYTAEQVAVVVDGVPVVSLDGAALDLSDLPLGQIERVELYRGMTPALLGSQAIGGTLRIDLRQPKTAGGEITTGAGSFGARQVEGAGNWAGKRARASLGLRWLQADGNFPFRTDNGTTFDTADDRTALRINNTVQRLGGTLGGHVDLGRGWALDGRWLGAWLHQGVPGPALFQAQDARMDTQRHLGVVTLTGRDVAARGDRLRGAVQASWNSNEVDDHLGELGMPWHARQHIAGLGTQWTWESPSWGPAILQSRVSAQHGTVVGRDLLHAQDQPESSRTTLGAGLALPIEGRQFQVVPSLSVDGQRSKRMTNIGAPFTWRQVDGHDDRLWSARLGLGWRPWAGVHLTAAATRGLRAPSLVELFGSGAFVTGNPLLRAEHATTFDAGLALAGKVGATSGGLQVTAFTSQVDDLIQLVPADRNHATFLNMTSADLHGLEWAATAVLWQRLRLTGQHTTLVARDVSGRATYAGKALPLRPRTRWNARADWTIPFQPWRANLWTDVQWQAGYFLDSANLAALPARTVAAAGLRVSRGAWYVDARIDDVFDAPRVDLIGFPLPGRTAFLALGWRLWDDDNQPET